MAAGLLVSATSTAQRRPPRVVPALRYEAPTGCPDRAEFEAALAVRSDAPPTDLAVTIRATADGYLGSLRRGSARRELAAPTCGELVAALALVAVMSGRAEAIAPPAATVPPPRSSVTTPPPPERGGRLELAIGVGVALAERGAGPDLELPLFVEARGAPERDARILGRLGVVRTTLEGQRGAGRAALTYTLARADLCAGGLGRGAPLRLWPCAVVEGGAVGVRVRGVADPQAPTRPFVGLGGGLRLELSTGRLRLALGLAAVRPVPRRRYYFAMDSTVFQDPAAELTGALDLAWRFL